MAKGVRTMVGAVAGLIAIVGVVVMVTRTSDTTTPRASKAATTITTSTTARGGTSDTSVKATTTSSTTTATTELVGTSVRYSHLPTISYSALPKEAKATLALAATEGPFPHPEDGTIFDNREHRLPRKERGHYREFTVDTPGASDRGARRIVIGALGERYYTDDHYNSFREIVNP